MLIEDMYKSKVDKNAKFVNQQYFEEPWYFYQDDTTFVHTKEGKDLLIGFNPKFFIDALRVIDEEEVMDQVLYTIIPQRINKIEIKNYYYDIEYEKDADGNVYLCKTK